MGVPPTRFGGFPVTLLSQTPLIFKCPGHLKMSGVCDNKVDGNIEIPSGGTPQDVHVFNMAATVEKSKEPILKARDWIQETLSTKVVALV